MKLNHTVFIKFLSGRSCKYRNVKKVDTDIEYSMYQLTDVNGMQVFIKSEVIEYIEFGNAVEIEVF